MRERGGRRDPPSGPHRIPVAQLHSAIQLTQRMGLLLSSRDVWGAHQDGEAGWGGEAHSLNYPPTNPCINNNNNKCLSTIKINKLIDLQGTVYPLLEQRSTLLRKFLNYICEQLERRVSQSSRDPPASVFGCLRVGHKLRLCRLLLEGCVTRRLKGLHSKSEGLWQTLEFLNTKRPSPLKYIL